MHMSLLPWAASLGAAQRSTWTRLGGDRGRHAAVQERTP